MSGACGGIFTIYGISDCPACLRACADTMDLYPTYEYVFVNTDFSNSFREKLKKKYEMTTFPIIVLEQNDNETMIGGHNDLLKFLSHPSKYGDFSTPVFGNKTEPD
jgi:glutaredoxin